MDVSKKIGMGPQHGWVKIIGKLPMDEWMIWGVAINLETLKYTFQMGWLCFHNLDF